MKKVKTLLILSALTAISFSPILATSGNITLYSTSAYYEVDNRPYLATLYMSNVYNYRDSQIGNYYTKYNNVTRYDAVLLTDTQSARGYTASASMDFYVNGSYAGHVSK